MLSFSDFLSEQAEGKGLTIFDIDETLFQTFAKIKVVQNGKTVRELDNQEFNTYKLKDGEEFDFGQFKNAELFNKTSQPIRKMLAKAKAILKNASSKGSKVIIITARSDFDDKKKFLNTFKKYGLDKVKTYKEGSESIETFKARLEKAITNSTAIPSLADRVVYGMSPLSNIVIDTNGESAFRRVQA
jgi:predicted secreted acid phosphatase